MNIFESQIAEEVQWQTNIQKDTRPHKGSGEHT